MSKRLRPLIRDGPAGEYDCVGRRAHCLDRRSSVGERTPGNGNSQLSWALDRARFLCSSAIWVKLPTSRAVAGPFARSLWVNGPVGPDGPTQLVALVVVRCRPAHREDHRHEEQGDDTGEDQAAEDSDAGGGSDFAAQATTEGHRDHSQDAGQ